MSFPGPNLALNGPASHGPVCVPVSSVSVSVTSRCSSETDKRRITKTILHDNPGILVF